MGIERSVRFSLRNLIFEYDEEKNRKNIEKHGISFKTAARVFFDYDRIEMYDEEHSAEEDRYNTIGDASAAGSTIIGNLCVEGSHRNDITPELEHRKSGYVERKRRPYQGNVVRIA